MNELRRQWGPVFWLLVGVAAVLFGISLINSDTVDCGGKKQGTNDLCVETGRGGSTVTRTQEEQRGNNRTYGYIGIGVGVLLIAGDGYVLYSRNRKKSGPSFAARQELAQARGWRYLPADSRLLDGWTIGMLSEGAQRKALGVISGTVDGTPFAIFDYERFNPRFGITSTNTIWLVRLTGQTQGFAEWARSGAAQEFVQPPLQEVYLTPTAVYANSVGTIGRRKNDQLVAGLDLLTGMVARFRQGRPGGQGSQLGRTNPAS